MSKHGSGFSKAERAIIFGKSVAVSKHQTENINPQEEKEQANSTKKRKFQQDEQEPPKETGTKRLKKLKDVSKDDELNAKVTIKLSKEECKSPEPKLVSYEEQAANYVSDKLDKFKFADNTKTSLDNKKTEKFKFVDDSKKNMKTLDAWKSQTDTQTKDTKPTVNPVKKEEKKSEKKVEIDPMAYFAMFSGGSTKKPAAEPAKANITKQGDMEVEESGPKEANESKKTVDSATKTIDITPSPAKEVEKEHSVQSEEPTIQQISNLTLEEEIPKEKKEVYREIVKEVAKEPAKIVQQISPEKAKPTPKEPAKKVEYRPFAGLTFAVVGVMNSVSSEELTNLILNFGGCISDEVTEDVHGLIMGTNMEDGSDVKNSPQYEAATWLDTRIYTEIEFDQYLFTKTGTRLCQEQEEDIPVQPSTPVFNQHESVSAMKTVEPMTGSKSKEQVIESAKMIEEVKTPVKNFMNQNSAANKSQAKQTQMQQEKTPSIIKRSAPELLWTDKYAPKNIGEIIGNQEMVRNLMTWLKDWEDVVIHNNKKPQKFNGGYQGKDNWGQSNVNAKACLVSGPPGIGKTTSVRLIAKTMGYEIVEQNASDVRNKSAVEGHLKHLTDNSLVSFSENKATNKKFLIIMDEVDGMSSGDRGGNQVLINAIKNTKTPIICICNDRQHPKVRSLANHCYDLRYQKPQKNFVAKRMKEIIGMEKLNVDLNSLEYLCENFGNDIRQLINFLQMHAKRSNTLSYNDTKGSFYKVKKDQTVMMNNFDAAKLLMTGHDMPVRDKIDLFFVDYDLIPLLVQENYVPNNPRASNEDLERVAVAAEMISFGDILSRSIRNNGEWGLLPNFAFIGAIYPCEIVNTNIGHPKFPEWLGKNSSQRKRQREVKELRAITSTAVYGATTHGILFDYAKGLLELINYNLQIGDKNKIDEVIEILDHYSITPDIIKEHLADVPFPPCKDPLSAVPTQIKSALTKSYNAKHKNTLKATKSKKGVSEEGGSGKRFNALAEDEDAGEASEEEETESNEEEDNKMEVEEAKPSTAQKASKQRGKGKDSKTTSAKKTK